MSMRERSVPSDMIRDAHVGALGAELLSHGRFQTPAGRPLCGLETGVCPFPPGATARITHTHTHRSLLPDRLHEELECVGKVISVAQPPLQRGGGANPYLGLERSQR